MKKRKTYTAEFKRETLRLAKTSGKSQAQIERDLGIGGGCLSRWKREQEEAGTEAFPGRGKRSSLEQDRVWELEKENEILRQERDILKKAVAIFSRPSR